ncbi:TadE family type IV pilus minor pilin [Streptomyces sp. NPDC101151]|uniref:TadE family type IV pilus minor pilin n=1 Tax=Streptomyces sp. NPDC101151 TaxID=3366115 RepID=UPI0037F38FB9
MRGCERGADRGFVTAESAVVLCVLVAFTMALVWGLLVVAAQIRCVDAARTGARAAARQDPADAVVEVTRQAAPRGARVTVGREGDQVRVTVVAEPPVLTGLPFEVREEAVAAVEEAGGAGSGPAAEDAGTAGPAGEDAGTAGPGPAGEAGP